MTKTQYIAYVVISLDGVIASDKKHMPDWTSKEDWQFLQKSLKAHDAFVMGRNTFEATAELKRRPNTFVLTSGRSIDKPSKNIKFINPSETNLKQVLGGFRKVAILGGAKTYRYMLDEGMIDEIYVTVEPVILGKGIRFISGDKGLVRLKLISYKKLNLRGTFLLHYRLGD